MVRLALLLVSIFAMTTAGVAVVVALLLGYGSLLALGLAAGIGLLLAVPLGWVAARAVR